MLRQDTGARCLLKGHNLVVTDLEFLSFTGTYMEKSTDFVSVLPSLAYDGTVYVCKIVRAVVLSRDGSSTTSGTTTSSTSGCGGGNGGGGSGGSGGGGLAGRSTGSDTTD